MSAKPTRKLRLPLLLALVLGVAYGVTYVLEGAPEGGALADARLRWLLAAFLAAAGVFAVQVVRFFVLDVAFLRAQGHRAPALVHVVVAMVLYFVLGLLIAGGVFHQSLTGAIATSAVASVVIGLALQETLGNFFSGIALQIEPPFRIGDVIGMGDHAGRVEAFNWRVTTIRTVDDARIAIPNALVAREPVAVFARDHLNRRILSIAAPYEVAPQRVIRLLRDVAAGIPGVSERRPPQVRVGSFDDSAIGYEVLYWVEDYLGVAGVDARIRERAWYAFARNGISIPYPHQVQVNYVDPAAALAGDGAAPGGVDGGPVAERERRLAEVALFAPLSPEERHRLAERARTLLFGPGEQVLRAGSQGGSMFVVLRGRIEIRVPKQPDGPRVRVAEMGPGEVFGEMSLLTGEPRSADAWALDETELMEVRKAEVGELLANNEALAEALSMQVSTRLGERTEALAQTDDAPPEPPSQATLLQKIRRFFDLR